MSIRENDPANYCSLTNISEVLRRRYATLGPCQPMAEDMPNGQFPSKTIRNRSVRFSEVHYSLKLADGSFQRRNWLTYSPHLDRVFCYSCVLFGLPSSKHLQFVKNGSNSWNNIHTTLQAHECNPEHLQSEINRSIFCSTNRVDVKSVSSSNADVSLNIEIVKILFNIVHYLAKHGLALRGKTENFSAMGEKPLGNFLDLVSLFAKYHPILANYLAKINNRSKRAITFLSNKTQNRMLQILGDDVRDSILKEVKKSKYFSVIIDTTTDVSKKDQFSVLLRYVRLTPKVEVVERLVAVDECRNSSAEGMFQLFKILCEKYDIDWRHHLIGKIKQVTVLLLIVEIIYTDIASFFLGQAYDGASSMRGQYGGLRTLIQKENESAIYVWCHAHILNLVIVDLCDSTQVWIICTLNISKILKFFGKICLLLFALCRTAEIFLELFRN